MKNTERNEYLTDFAKATLTDRYLLPDEDYQDLFVRVAKAYGSNAEHTQRLYEYISKLWFMPATPVLSNGGTSRGLPISCYLNHVDDSMNGILETWKENGALSSQGGGIGTYWGDVRSLGEPISATGKTSGVIPFIKVQDSMTLAVSQGSLRRGSSAAYLDINHPEIIEFIELRKPSGDIHRKSLNIHHGVLVTNAFMEAVEKGTTYDLISPLTGEVVETLDARTVWSRLLETRVATGEPYIVFIDLVNEARPEHHKKLGLLVSTSNLCSEIVLPTDKDRTAVCCLSSLNLETWDEWKDNDDFIHDVMEFLDNVLEDYIQRAPPAMARAVYSASQERSVGLGVMGFHSYLQSKGIAFESAMAKAFNLRAFKRIRSKVDEANMSLCVERGPCPDAEKTGSCRRFSYTMAIAPTASISVIAGGTSACIEPIPANVYTHKTLSGSFTVRNKYLDNLITAQCFYELLYSGRSYQVFDDKKYDGIWADILAQNGSVQHLDFLSDHDKKVFKTSLEIDQRWIIEFAADRTPYIDQAQSLNLFVPADIDKWDLHNLHFSAWKKGVKSLYYLRSKSVLETSRSGGVEADNVLTKPSLEVVQTDYEACLACE